jgi:hypothetical protein
MTIIKPTAHYAMQSELLTKSHTQKSARQHSSIDPAERMLLEWEMNE